MIESLVSNQGKLGSEDSSRFLKRERNIICAESFQCGAELRKTVLRHQVVQVSMDYHIEHFRMSVSLSMIFQKLSRFFQYDFRIFRFVINIESGEGNRKIGINQFCNRAEDLQFFLF